MSSSPARKSYFPRRGIARHPDLGQFRFVMKADLGVLDAKLDALRAEIRIHQAILCTAVTIRFGVMLAVCSSLFFPAMKVTAS